MKDTYLKCIRVMVIIICGMLGVRQNVKAADQKSWQSVYTDEIKRNDFRYEVTYGDFVLAKVKNTLYIQQGKKKSVQKVKTPYQKYGGVLTNGTDILYQNGKKVILWKSPKKKKVFIRFQKQKDLLIARYGNQIFFGRYKTYDVYQLYSYNIKTKKTVRLPYQNAYYGNGRYLIVNGKFHGQDTSTLMVYDIKTKKSIKIDKKCSSDNAAIISGNTVYYFAFREYEWDVKTYSLRSGKKKTIYSTLMAFPRWLDHRHVTCIEDSEVEVFEIGK